MKTTLLSLCLLCGSLLAAPEGIETLEQDYLDTWRTNDSDVADGILHRDYAYIGADGERHNRTWTISMIGSGRLVYESVRIDRGLVHDLDDIVVTVGTLRAPGTWEGKPMVDHLAYTMIWVREDGQWKLLSEHNSRVSTD